jgi:hypothetical protein
LTAQLEPHLIRCRLTHGLNNSLSDIFGLWQPYRTQTLIFVITRPALIGLHGNNFNHDGPVTIRPEHWLFCIFVGLLLLVDTDDCPAARMADAGIIGE